LTKKNYIQEDKKMNFNFTRSLSVGGVASAMTYFRYPSGNISLYGQAMPLWAGVGISVMLGSLISETLHSQVYPNISPEERLTETVSLATSVGLTAGSTSGVLYLSNPVIVSELGLGQIAIASLASELIGDWVDRKIVKGE
jgi:hypothetical protein